MPYLSASEGRASEASGFVTTLAYCRVEVGACHYGLRCRSSEDSPGSDAIWVVEDQLTKSAHFIPMRVRDSVDHLAGLYIQDIVRLHGVTVTIVSDRDPRFTAKLWQSL